MRDKLRFWQAFTHILICLYEIRKSCKIEPRWNIQRIYWFEIISMRKNIYRSIFELNYRFFFRILKGVEVQRSSRCRSFCIPHKMGKVGKIAINGPPNHGPYNQRPVRVAKSDPVHRAATRTSEKCSRKIVKMFWNIIMIIFDRRIGWVRKNNQDSSWIDK